MEQIKILKNWSLLLAPHADVVKTGFLPKKIADLEKSPYLKIPATVPGCMELDLHAAGLAPDPYFGENPLAYRQYENRHLYYYTTFDCESINKNVALRFEGVDTVTEVYLNGVPIGAPENMLIAHELGFIDQFLKKKKNELIVHILPATIAARGMEYELTPLNRAPAYNHSALFLRKAAYMYGWDIMPRFVSGGLWKPVYLVQKSDERLEQCYLYTTRVKPADNTARLTAFVQFETDRDFLSDLRVTVDGVCGDSTFHGEKVPFHTFENFVIKVVNAKLWYPKHYGDQPLYDVTFRLWRGDTVVDERSFRFGIRTVELERTSILDENGNGKFGFIVNGKKIFCLGTNWVPLDAFPCRHKERLPAALALLEDSGCNTVRCWGGNVYEDDAFYDFCDEKGILVWQDFGMGCAIYPEDGWFLEGLKQEAIAVIKRLRNHPALMLWAGDNEVDITHGWHGFAHDMNDYTVTRKVLADAVRRHDCMRPYIPSSPYIDSVAFETKQQTPEDHLWGPRDYFKGNFYKNAKSCFASEIGYHGCPSPKSLEKFISKENLYPMLDEKGNGTREYLVHAAAMEPEAGKSYTYRIRLMVDQVRTLFGAEADNLFDFSKQSQISQAEAKKYFIEKFRIGKPHRTGIIWWNLLDGWPQVSDAVVDWYYCKKLAYHFIKRSQEPLCLMFDEPENGELRLFAVQDGGREQSIHYTVRDIVSNTVLLKGNTTVGADSAAPIAAIPETDAFRFLLIEWSTADGKEGKNHFTTKTLNISYQVYLEALQKCGMDEFEGF